MIVADASASVRQAMRAVLEPLGWCVDVHVDSVAGLLDGDCLVSDCVLLDHELPGGALLAIRRLAGMTAAPAVLLIGPNEDEVISLAAVRAGARGVIPRNSDVQSVALAMETVFRGGVSLRSELVAAVVRDYQAGHGLAVNPSMAPFPYQLSVRERRVLELLAEGMTTSQIATTLFVTAATVRSHVAGIVRSVGVSDRHAALERFASWSEQAAALRSEEGVGSPRRARH